MTSGYVPLTPDFDFITARLAVGARVGPQGLAHLREMGITHLLAIDSHPPISLAQHYGVSITSHPFPDDLQEKPLSLLLPIAHVALAILAQPGAVLLVTCGAGMYRAPMVALLILRLLGFSSEDARGLIAAKRWGVGFPGAYVQSVERTVQAWQNGAQEGRAFSEPM